MFSVENIFETRLTSVHRIVEYLLNKVIYDKIPLYYYVQSITRNMVTRCYSVHVVNFCYFCYTPKYKQTLDQHTNSSLSSTVKFKCTTQSTNIISTPYKLILNMNLPISEMFYGNNFLFTDSLAVSKIYTSKAACFTSAPVTSTKSFTTAVS